MILYFYKKSEMFVKNGKKARAIITHIFENKNANRVTLEFKDFMDTKITTEISILKPSKVGDWVDVIYLPEDSAGKILLSPNQYVRIYKIASYQLLAIIGLMVYLHYEGIIQSPFW